jgi:hypothetical protein
MALGFDSTQSFVACVRYDRCNPYFGVFAKQNARWVARAVRANQFDAVGFVILNRSNCVCGLALTGHIECKRALLAAAGLEGDKAVAEDSVAVYVTFDR